MCDLEVFSKTDIGLVRRENQDSASFSVISSGCVWAVVCDGMGGAAGGKTASSTAVDYIADRLNTAYTDTMPENQIVDLLINTVEGANRLIYEMAVSDSSLSGMGTTCELVFIKGSKIYVIHVGDSRTYSIRGGKILQLTEDHSMVQEMLRRGEITEEQAMHHPNKNYITRAMGVQPDVRIDYIEAEFSYGDVILICTDGLSNNVSEADMVKIVHENRGVSMIDALVETAKNNGGSDNITVTVIY